MKISRLISIVSFVLLTGFTEGCSAQKQHGAQTDKTENYEIFKPDLIERSHSVQIDADPDEVFKLLAPGQAKKWSQSKHNFDKQKLFSGTNGEIAGHTLLLTGDHGQIWSVVAEYNREDRLLRKINIYPGIEFLINEMRCDSNPRGGTTLTVTWKVTGMTNDGNEAVRNFMDSGMFETQTDAIGRQMNAFFANMARE